MIRSGMKLIFAVLMSLGVATVAIAQQAAAPAAAPARPPGNPHAAVPLWANGAPGSDGKTAPEVVTGDADSGRSVTTVNNPSIAPYLVRGRGPNATPVAAIIIAPGGGHYKLTMDDEGYDVAKYLSGHGVAAFVLKYRLAHEPGSTYTVDGDEMHDIQRAIRFLGENYEFVVIDCPHGVHNLSLTTIDCCDELYLIATPDVPALRDLSRYIDRLLQSNVPPAKIKVVINRFSAEGALSLEQIEKAIRQPIAITIPNSSTDLIRAMNTGNPILPERKSEFAIQMSKWAASLVPAPNPSVAEPKRRFSFWN